MTNPPPLVSAAADVLQQEGVIDVPRAGLCPGNFPMVTDAGAGRQPAIVSVMHPLSPPRRIRADRRRDLWRTERAQRSVERNAGHPAPIAAFAADCAFVSASATGIRPRNISSNTG